MGLFDKFKKKDIPESIVLPTGNDGFPEAELMTDTVVTISDTEKDKIEEVKQKTTQEVFEEWYSNLSPTDQKRFDAKQERYRLKKGIPVVCIKCKRYGSNKETGPYIKVDSGYAHEHCIRG